MIEAIYTKKCTVSEAINLSLSTLIFAYNNHFSTFHSPDVQLIYKSSEIMDTSITCSKDFLSLSHNSLLAAFQSHCIILHEAILRYCLVAKRENMNDGNQAFYAIKRFVAELRHSQAHMKARFLHFTWDKDPKDKKKPFRFTVSIPVSKIQNGVRYEPYSKVIRKIIVQGTPGIGIRITLNFIHKIILISFHLRKILSFRKASTCDAYLNRYKSIWLSRPR